jgi:hypothetical protein
MLTVIPKTWSYAFRVTEGSEPIAETENLSWWRDRARFQIQGSEYTARRDKSAFTLESANQVLARAERPRRWRRELLVEHSGRQFLLRQESAFRRGFLVFENAMPLGFISPAGVLTRKAKVELPEELPLYLRVFIIWLVMTTWKRQEAA